MDAPESLNSNVVPLISRLKKDLAAFQPGMATLESGLESAAKHLPAYLKIVKIHIEQLAVVLKLDTHNHRTLETAGLAGPVQQLIKLFSDLKEQDLQTLEELAAIAKNWHTDTAINANATSGNSHRSIETDKVSGH